MSFNNIEVWAICTEKDVMKILCSTPEWLATTNAFISCRYGDMTISHGNLVKKITLHPHAKHLIELENTRCIDDANNDE
jgi:hypothetical protein